jgi:hypothetical protein
MLAALDSLPVIVVMYLGRQPGYFAAAVENQVIGHLITTGKIIVENAVDIFRGVLEARIKVIHENKPQFGIFPGCFKTAFRSAEHEYQEPFQGEIATVTVKVYGFLKTGTDENQIGIFPPRTFQGALVHAAVNDVVAKIVIAEIVVENADILLGPSWGPSAVTTSDKGAFFGTPEAHLILNQFIESPVAGLNPQTGQFAQLVEARELGPFRKLFVFNNFLQLILQLNKERQMACLIDFFELKRFHYSDFPYLS